MLKQIKLLALLVTAGIWLTACEKEYSLETGGLTGGGSGTFRARVDGSPWSADIIKTARRTGGMIELKGRNAAGQQIVLTVRDSGVYQYQLNSTSNVNFGVYIDSTVAPYEPYSTNQWFTDSLYGYVNITSIDTVRKTMSGTFKMKVFRTIDSGVKDITEGVFSNISYGPPATTPPPAPANNFFVRVDGTEFVDNSFTASELLGNVVINAASGSGATVTIVVPATIAAGTYNFNAAGQITGTYASNTNVYLAQAGTMVIQEHNTATNFIRATFSFTGTDLMNPGTPDVTLTEGALSVTYN
ncbi:MAG TPA: DUF6252 family protein [Ferruginibacter sp.]|nr:DUF6252 family protein [Ferruginibacter sp.]HRO17354.1 DUF6252 family protein [Ferruginibacter sp.]HRQ21763.1 DUF6252 family protein [Ferruginibacter sp.]